MQIITLVFWVFVIVFAAWGTHTLLCRLVKPRVINVILLPGTLVAQLGHVLGLLVTGNEVRNTALMGDDEAGDPKSDVPEKHKVPVLGSIVVGMLPIIACAGALCMAKQYLGTNFFSIDVPVTVSESLPTSFEGFWKFGHSTLDAMEAMTISVALAGRSWTTFLYLYLAICLTIRMAPFEQHRRGAITAIAAAGLVVWLLSFIPQVPVGQWVSSGWPVLSFAAAMALFLLLASLLVSGIVGLIKVLVRGE